MSPGRGTRGLRARLTLAALVAVTVGVGLLTAAFNVVLHARLDAEVDDLLRARAAAQIATLSTVDGHLTISEAPDIAAQDSPVWVFASSRVLEHPQRAAPSVDRAAAQRAGGPRRTADVAAPSTRLLAVPVRRAGRRVGTVVVAASLAPYQSTEDVALVASLVLAVVLIGAVGLFAGWLLRAALRPVARMTADAADWSERDLDRRFGLGPPTDELTLLGATLDELLGRLAAALRREQRFSAELSHELRTPLAKISTGAQLLASAPDLAPGLREEALGIVRATKRMHEAIETLMTAARAESDGARGTADVTQASRSVVDAARPLAVERDVALELVANGAGVRARAEPELVERMLTPLVENACRLARAHASVRIERAGQWTELVVEDDGPGLAPGEEQAIFEPGRRGSAGRESHDGAGLGLPLARRLARSAGGDVEADPDAAGGRFVVRLPGA